MNRTRNAIRSSFSGVFNKIITIIGSFITQTIIIKIIGVEYAGLNSLFTSILTVLSMAELGFGSALVYSMYRPIVEGNTNAINAYLNYYKKVYRIITIAVLVLGAILIPFLPKLVKGDCPADINLYILYFLYLFHTASGYFDPAYMASLMYAHQRRDVINNVLSIVRILQYVVQIVFLIIWKNYYLYIIPFAISTIPVNLLVYWWAKKMYPDYCPEGDISVEERKDIQSRVTALFGHELGGKVIISSDSIIISAILGVGALGIYSNYYYILSSIVAILDIIRLSLIAGIGNKAIKDSKQQNLETFNMCSYLWMGIVGFASVSMLCLFQDFITLWVGEKLLLSKETLLVIIIYFYFWQFRTIGLVFKDASGLWKEDWYKPYLGIIVNIIFSVVLTIVLQNVVGVLIPTILIMIFIYYPIETKVIFKHLFDSSASRYIITNLFYLVLTIVGGSICYILCEKIHFSSIVVQLVIKFFICAIIPNIIYFGACFKSNENKSLLKLLRGIICKNT